MQLNPARGRKQAVEMAVYSISTPGLCSSTPRGDGNYYDTSALWQVVQQKVYAAQPREGTETSENPNLTGAPKAKVVYAAQPREGTETKIII